MTGKFTLLTEEDTPIKTVQESIILHSAVMPEECRESYMKVGILTKIRSPEGVSTTFDYEINRHGKSIERYMDGHKSDTIFYTGGLRIQKITESNMSGGLSRTRSFTYRSYPKNSYSRSTEHSGDGWGIPKVGLSERDYCVEQRLLKINPTTGTQEECRLRTWGFRSRIEHHVRKRKLGIVPVCNRTNLLLFKQK